MLCIFVKFSSIHFQYGIAGCMATVASVCPINALIISVAVFSLLVFFFGLAAAHIGFMSLVYAVNCDSNSCVTEDGFSMAGNTIIGATGFYQSLFGICLFAISVRAICKASTTRVSNKPDTVHFSATQDYHQPPPRAATENKSEMKTESDDYTTKERQHRF